MGKKNKSSYKIPIFFLIIGVLFIGVYIGLFLSNSLIPKSTTDNNIPTLNDSDKNWLTQVVYSGGTCERLGFNMSILVQFNKDSNTYYGIPICVERTG